jgi:transposase
MPRKPYPTDLSDQQWHVIKSLIPPSKAGGRPRTVEMREILNAIFYILASGCGWRMLPHDLPPNTVRLSLKESGLNKVVSQKRFEDRESFSIPVAYCAIPKS